MAIVDKKIEIKKSGSAMTSAISQLVYMPNFRAIGPPVTEKNGKTQKDRKTERQFFFVHNSHLKGYFLPLFSISRYPLLRFFFVAVNTGTFC